MQSNDNLLIVTMVIFNAHLPVINAYTNSLESDSPVMITIQVRYNAWKRQMFLEKSDQTLHNV